MRQVYDTLRRISRRRQARDDPATYDGPLPPEFAGWHDGLQGRFMMFREALLDIEFGAMALEGNRRLDTMDVVEFDDEMAATIAGFIQEWDRLLGIDSQAILEYAQTRPDLFGYAGFAAEADLENPGSLRSHERRVLLFEEILRMRHQAGLDQALAADGSRLVGAAAPRAAAWDLTRAANVGMNQPSGYMASGADRTSQWEDVRSRGVEQRIRAQYQAVEQMDRASAIYADRRNRDLFWSPDTQADLDLRARAARDDLAKLKAERDAAVTRQSELRQAEDRDLEEARYRSLLPNGAACSSRPLCAAGLPPGTDAVQMSVPVELMGAAAEPMRLQAVYPISGDTGEGGVRLSAEYFSSRGEALDRAIMLGSAFGPRAEVFAPAGGDGRDADGWAASLDSAQEQVLVLRHRENGQDRFSIGVQCNGGTAAQQAICELGSSAQHRDVAAAGSAYQQALSLTRRKAGRLAADSASALGVNIRLREDTQQTRAQQAIDGFYQVHFVGVPRAEVLSSVAHSRHGSRGGAWGQRGGSVYVETNTQHVDKAVGGKMLMVRDPLSGWSEMRADISLQDNPHRIFPTTLQAAVDSHDASAGVVPPPTGQNTVRHPDDVRRLGLLTPATPADGFGYYPRLTSALESDLDRHSGGAWRARTDMDTVLLKTGLRAGGQ